MNRADAARINGKNGGRPTGSLNKSTLERRKVLQAVQQRIMDNVDTILNSQMMLARGKYFLYKVEKYYENVKDDKGKSRRILRAKPPVIVDNEVEITAYLQEQVNEFNEEGIEIDNSPDADYFFIVAKPPDNKAIEGLKATAFGKAIQPIRFADEDGDDIFDAESKAKAQKALGAVLGKTYESKTTKKTPAARIRRRGAAHTGKRG